MSAEETRPILAPGGHEAHDAPKSRGLGKLAIATALFGVFLANIDDSFVAAIYGEIASRFQHLQDGPWLLAGYNLGYCAALPVHGRLGDLYGRKTPLLVAYVLFGLGLAVSGSAFSLWQVIIGRVLTGIGSSGVVGLVSIVITDISTLEQVAVLRSYVTVVAIAGYSLGAPLGGLLADLVGWRMSFLIQVPIVLICLAIVQIEIPSSLSPAHDEDPSTSTPENNTDTYSNNNEDSNSKKSSTTQSFDIPGLFTFILAIITFLIFLNTAGQKLPWTHPFVLATAAICGTSATLFFLIETVWSPAPLIPLVQIWESGVGLFCLAQVFLFVALLGLVAQVTDYFIRTQYATNAEAAAHLLPLTVGCAVGGLFSGQIINKTHRYKPLSLLSILLNTTSHLLIFLTWRSATITTTTTTTTTTAPTTSNYPILSSLASFLVGLAHGLVISSQFVGMSTRASKSQVASAVSTYYLCQQLGMMAGAFLGAAVKGGVLGGMLGRKLAGHGGGGGGDDDGKWLERVVDGVLSDNRFAMTLPDDVQRVVVSCYLYAFQFIPVLSISSCIVALILIVAQKEKRLA